MSVIYRQVAIGKWAKQKQQEGSRTQTSAAEKQRYAIPVNNLATVVSSVAAIGSNVPSPKFWFPRSITPRRLGSIPHFSANTSCDHPLLRRIALILIPMPSCASLRRDWLRAFRWPAPAGLCGVQLHVLPRCRKEVSPRTRASFPLRIFITGSPHGPRWSRRRARPACRPASSCSHGEVEHLRTEHNP